MKILASLLLASCFLLITSLWAVPISKVQVAPRRGVVIATVDLEKVFQAYPGTKKAKEDLENIILVKENEILTQRSAIFQLTQEINQLRPNVSSAPAIAPASSTETLKTATTTQIATMVSTATVQTAAVISTTTVTTVPGLELPATATVPTTQSFGGRWPATGGSPAVTISTTNILIAQKEVELAQKQEILKTLERNTETNLEALEEAKTKTLLGRIFLSLRELAEEKNVDIIVDRNAILWGSSKLDLTLDLLEKLKSKYIEKE